MNKRPLVSIVDDSESVRESLPDLLRQFGFPFRRSASAEDVSRLGRRLDDTGCLILDVGLPGMSGPDLQRELKRLGQAIPIVFITAQGDKSLQPRLVAPGRWHACSSPSATPRCSKRSKPRCGRGDHDAVA